MYGVTDAKQFLLEQALSGGEEDKCQPDFLVAVVPSNHNSCTQLVKSLNDNSVPFERRKFNLEFNSGKMTQAEEPSANGRSQSPATR